MVTCDVLVVGGGPAGSTCAWTLTRAGFTVLVVDRACFPRHKACAGWITPRVFEALQLQPEQYAAGRSLDAITGFRTAVIGGRLHEVRYGRTVSYAIRRTEFDAYLLERSDAALRLGYRVEGLRLTADGWVVNDEIHAPVIIGAGGHFCPVARALNPPPDAGAVVAARDIEFQMRPDQAAACAAEGRMPEIYLDRDLSGYGWIVRKGDVLNVGFGRIGAGGLASHVSAFVGDLRRAGRLPPGTPDAWPGHAYLVRETTRRLPVGERVLLVGDAAGLARGCSGEGIRAAVESGLAAAETVMAARGSYDRASLRSYLARLDRRLGPVPARPGVAGFLPLALRVPIGRALLGNSRLARRLLLDRWLAA